MDITEQRNPADTTSEEKDGTESALTDQKDNVEHKEGDDRPVKNATQQGYGINDGSNHPLSKEMLNDLQDAGQDDLQRQREEEKAAKANKD